MTESSSHDAPLRLLLAARSSRKPRKDASGESAPDEGLGIQTQDERAREWAEREGHVIVDIAADVRSGEVPPWDRPNLRPWVACGCGWCRDQDDKRNVPERRRVYDHGKITRYDGILAFKMDRLSRGGDQDFALIEGWASHHGKQRYVYYQCGEECGNRARLDTEGRTAFLTGQRFRVYATRQTVRLERGEGERAWRAHYDRRIGVIDDEDRLPEDVPAGG